jgi:steroid 5-alpha reductase family enzyme
MNSTMFAAAVVIAAAMLLLWLASLILRNASIIDAFWGLGFVIVAWVAAFLRWPPTDRGWFLVALTTVWGLRLSLFLLWRNGAHGEDRRYAAMRARHGERFWWVSLFTVFLLQGAALWWVSLPLQIALAANTDREFDALDVLGCGLWGVGLFFETVGDWQLARFKANPANTGCVLDHGLWRYTRHPNYFGDFCVWWGLYFIASAAGAAWTVASPVLMTYLLLRVSGVTLIERTITDRRPEYARYQDRTNAFFPGPGRSA